MLFFSCSGDDGNPVATNSTDLIFDHYTVETTFNDGSGLKQFTTANLQNQKFFSETSEALLNGQSQGQSTAQHYFYENGLLAKRIYPEDVRDFFYDSQGRLIALNWRHDTNLSIQQFYRFVYASENVVYFEWLTLPYSDPGTAINRRIIIVLDSNSNITEAGYDAQLDGVMDAPLRFGYDNRDNLSSITNPDGEQVAISYAELKDNFAKLTMNTYGKRNFVIYQAECYVARSLDLLRHSPNLRTTDIQESVIEAGPEQYYSRKTRNFLLSDGNASEVTTFYFQ